MGIEAPAMARAGHTSAAEVIEWWNVCFWHKADIGLRGVNVSFGGKAGVGAARIALARRKAGSKSKIRMRQPLPAVLTGRSKNWGIEKRPWPLALLVPNDALSLAP
jgi:hypothetical protein